MKLKFIFLFHVIRVRKDLTFLGAQVIFRVSIVMFVKQRNESLKIYSISWTSQLVEVIWMIAGSWDLRKKLTTPSYYPWNPNNATIPGALFTLSLSILIYSQCQEGARDSNIIRVTWVRLLKWSVKGAVNVNLNRVVKKNIVILDVIICSMHTVVS